MSSKETAIKLWVDESTEVNGDHTLVGYLITDCYRKEFSFFQDLTSCRVKERCFTTLHGHEITGSDKKKLNLFDAWLEVFRQREYDSGIYFHTFLYKKTRVILPEEKAMNTILQNSPCFHLPLK